MKDVNPTNLNLALYDAKWAAKGKEWSDRDRPASCFNLKQRSTCLLPGMELRIEQNSGQEVGNSMVPIITQFDWILPESYAWTRKDLFALSYLMTAASAGDKRGNASACYEAWLGRPAELPSRFYLPMLKQSTVNWETRTPGNAPSAVTVQQWMRWAPAAPPPPGKPPSDQWLTIELPPLPNDVRCGGLNTFTALKHGSAWQVLGDDSSDVPAPKPPYPDDPYYPPDTVIASPRTLITVLIPVTVDRAVRYMPIDSSIADVERTAGVQVARIDRVAQLSPADAFIKPTAKRFSIVLTRRERVFRWPNEVPMPRPCAPDILLAPGDEVVLSDTPTSTPAGKSVSCVK